MNAASKAIPCSQMPFTQILPIPFTLVKYNCKLIYSKGESQIMKLIWEEVSVSKKLIDFDLKIVDESLQININQIFWDFYFSKTNSRTKSLRIGLTNPELRVCKSWFVSIRDLQIFFKDLFCAIVLKICKDLWKSILQTLKICWIRDHKLNP